MSILWRGGGVGGIGSTDRGPRSRLPFPDVAFALPVLFSLLCFAEWPVRCLKCRARARVCVCVCVRSVIRHHRALKARREAKLEAPVLRRLRVSANRPQPL